MNKRYFVCLSLFAVYASLIFAYHYAFVEESDGDLSKGGSFSRVMIPDAILYGQLAQFFGSDGLDPILSWQISSRLALVDINQLSFMSLVRTNLFGPSLLAHLMGNIRFGDLLINSVLIGLTGVFFVRILDLLDISSNLPLWVLFLNPESIYYSQGFLKEIPCLFLTTLFIYLLLKRRYLSCLLPIVLAIIIRYEITFVFLAILCFELIPFKHKYRYLQLSLLIFFALLPLLYGTFLRRAVEGYYSYREESGPGSGIGSMIAYLQFNFPFFGYIGIPARFFQTMIEPFPDVTLFSDGNGIVNIYYCILSASMIMMTYFYIEFLKYCLRISIKAGDRIWSHPASKIMFVIYIYLLLVGVNTFISHRFMYAVVPLMSFIVFGEKKDEKPLSYAVILTATVLIYSLNISRYLLSM
jgi:hypothetical protein